jgi:HAMP domain-containing protein
MKIRTRFLLFLFPNLALGIALVLALFTYTWYKASEKLVGLIGNVEKIDAIFQESLLPIALSIGVVLSVVWITMFVIANKISRPIQKLNNAALALAAGQYGESIAAEGPKEIVELAGTLNIMSECLLEHINRLKENAWLRERMYGEYECARLLQHMMLQKNIDDCRSDACAMHAITFFSDTPKGFLLKFPKPPKSNLFLIQLTEAEEEGLEGMYQLLTQGHLSQKQTTVSFDKKTCSLQTQGQREPLIWSAQKKQWMRAEDELSPGDFFFLFNQALLRLYKSPQHLENVLAKVLKVFAQDGFKVTVAMLQKEISLSLKRKELPEDVHLLCFQMLYKNEREDYPLEQLKTATLCPL